MNELHRAMREMYKTVDADVCWLDEYIERHRTSGDFDTLNIVSIKEKQLDAMIELKQALENALWERYDDNLADL